MARLEIERCFEPVHRHEIAGNEVDGGRARRAAEMPSSSDLAPCMNKHVAFTK